MNREICRLVDQPNEIKADNHTFRNKCEPCHPINPEIALRQSEVKFRLAFDTSPDSINFNRLSDGVYIDINEGFTKLTGYAREDVIGKSSLELNIWYDPKDRQRLVKALKTNGYIENLEAKFRRKSGQVGVGLMSARVLSLNQEEVILSITRDITERKQVEDSLRESETRYHQLFDASTDAILVRTGETIIHANPAALKLFRARHVGELVGKRYLDFVHPDDRPESAERIRKSMDGNWIVPLREHRLISLDGEVMNIESAGVPIRYQGEIQHFGMFRDITDRKKAEERLRESEEQHRQIVESSTDAILVRAGDVIVYANPAALKLFRASHI
ncbi:MAG: PAS domain S-box protein [Hyphomicrobiales bacterium]